METLETHTGFIVKILRQKECGFIRLADGSEDLYFHISGVVDEGGFDSLREGHSVVFIITENPGSSRRKAIAVMRE